MASAGVLAGPAHADVAKYTDIELGAGVIVTNPYDSRASEGNIVDGADGAWAILDFGLTHVRPLGENSGLQFDLDFIYSDNDGRVDGGPGSGQLVHALDANLHYLYHPNEQTTLGGVVGMSHSFGNEDDTNGLTPVYAISYNVGLEGQYKFERSSLFGQIGFFDGYATVASSSNPDDGIANAVYAMAQFRYFPSDDVRYLFGVTYGQGDDDGDVERGNVCTDGGCRGYDFGSIEARYDRQLDNGWQIFGSVSYNEMYMPLSEPAERDGTDGMQDWVAMVGVTWTFGEALSLFEKDRRGASFDTPNIGVWQAYSTEAVDTGN